MRRVHLVVSGRVQGVFYRASCAREAETQGVAGWVRNLPDGRVEIVVEGPGPQVDAMVAWCREGPPGARVKDVEIVHEDAVGETGFRVVG